MLLLHAAPGASATLARGPCRGETLAPSWLLRMAPTHHGCLVTLGTRVPRRAARRAPVFAQMRAFSSNYPEHVILPMPALSPTMTHGTLVRWEVQEGDEVAAGDSIAEVRVLRV